MKLNTPRYLRHSTKFYFSRTNISKLHTFIYEQNQLLPPFHLTLLLYQLKNYVCFDFSCVFVLFKLHSEINKMFIFQKFKTTFKNKILFFPFKNSSTEREFFFASFVDIFSLTLHERIRMGMVNHHHYHRTNYNWNWFKANVQIISYVSHSQLKKATASSRK